MPGEREGPWRDRVRVNGGRKRAHGGGKVGGECGEGPWRGTLERDLEEGPWRGTLEWDLGEGGEWEGKGYKKGVRRGECGRIREREVSWRDEAEVSEEEEGSRRGYGRRGWGGEI